MVPQQVRQVTQQARVYRGIWQNYERETGRSLSWFSVLQHFLRWRSSLSPGRSPISDRIPWIVYDAQQYLARRILAANRVFEFGGGGSTVFFLDQRCEVVTVEHDATWLASLRSAITPDARWTCHLIPPQELSQRESESTDFRSCFPGYERKSFEAYVRSLEKYPNGYFDVILVDGRARSAALAIAPAKVKRGGLIILDNAERKRYASAVRNLEASGWQMLRFAGPGPYVGNEFWDTCVFLHPAE